MLDFFRISIGGFFGPDPGTSSSLCWRVGCGCPSCGSSSMSFESSSSQADPTAPDRHKRPSYNEPQLASPVSTAADPQAAESPLPHHKSRRDSETDLTPDGKPKRERRLSARTLRFMGLRDSRTVANERKEDKEAREAELRAIDKRASRTCSVS